MSTPVIKVEMRHYSLRVYINDILHVCIPRPLFGAFQSWRDGPNHFSIEYYLKDGTKLLTEYDDPEKWKAILAGLDRECDF